MRLLIMMMTMMTTTMATMEVVKMMVMLMTTNRTADTNITMGKFDHHQLQSVCGPRGQPLSDSLYRRYRALWRIRIK
eukprot:1138055-Karenia_brevis.AAC.1